jgi:cytochrome c biogenesis factor
MPWLTGTAFLHSIMVQKRRGILKAWNASLVLATGFLAVLGTFLVRSGVLERTPSAPRPSASHSSCSSRCSRRFIVSPLVEWIWLGGLIVLAGGLVALWPGAVLARLRQASGMLAPRSSSPRDPKMRRSASSIATSLMLASRRRM